jgi:hypothetical protein
MNAGPPQFADKDCADLPNIWPQWTVQTFR